MFRITRGKVILITVLGLTAWGISALLSAVEQVRIAAKRSADL
jgi:hypothetical protein